MEYQPPDGNRFRTVADELPAIKNLFQERMGFPLLKGFVRVELWIRVFEANDQADRHAVVRETINPAAAIHVSGDRPTERVGHVAWLDAAGLNVPQLFDANAVDLRIDVVELVFLDQLLGERAARAFGEDGDFGAKFITGRVVGFALAVLVEAFIFGDDAGDALLIVNQLRPAKLREEIHS